MSTDTLKSIYEKVFQKLSVVHFTMVLYVSAKGPSQFTGKKLNELRKTRKW